MLRENDDIVLIDEAQFLTPEQVRQLHRLAHAGKVPVMCYGLRSDFRGEAFPGAAALLGAVLTGDARLLQTTAHGRPRIGLFPSPAWPDAEPDTQMAWENALKVLARDSGHCQDVSTPQNFSELIQLQKDVMAHEMARALAHERVRHRTALSPQLQALMDLGLTITGAAHAANLQRTADWRQRIDVLFEQHDVLLTPSTTGAAPVGLSATGDPLFCRSWSLLGLPTVHLPFATSAQGLPVGLQLVGRMHEDHKLLAAAQDIHARLRGHAG